jgi:hypothetical protein
MTVVGFDSVIAITLSALPTCAAYGSNLRFRNSGGRQAALMQPRYQIADATLRPCARIQLARGARYQQEHAGRALVIMLMAAMIMLVAGYGEDHNVTSGVDRICFDEPQAGIR